MKKNTSIFIALVLVISFGIYFYTSPPQEKPQNTETPNETKGSEIESYLGQTIEFENFQITLLDISEDSRCPIDVVCIQAGTVRIALEIFSEEEMQFETLTLEEPLSIQNKTITLTKVLPVAHSQTPIDFDDYQLFLHIK